MLLKLFLLFTVVPIAELAVLIELGTIIGTANTIMIILFTGVGGAILAKTQGLSVISKIQNELQTGRVPAEELINGVFVLVGGGLLLTPGIITDILGFTLLIPFTRNLCKRWLRHKLEQKLSSGEVFIDWHWR